MPSWAGMPWETGDWVGLAGLLLATASITWQIATYLLQGRTRVKVAVSFGIGVGGVPDLALITVTNMSAFPVRITAAGIGLQDETNRYVPVINPPPEYAIPVVIPGKDAHTTGIPIQDLEAAGIDIFRPVVARVHIATGPWKYSKGTRLMRH